MNRIRVVTAGIAGSHSTPWRTLSPVEESREDGARTKKVKVMSDVINVLPPLITIRQSESRPVQPDITLFRLNKKVCFSGSARVGILFGQP